MAKLLKHIDNNLPVKPRFAESFGIASLPRVDEEILNFWKTDGTFQASIDGRPQNEQFVFYDGPPFANGLPHYGHLLTGFAKDVIPRFQTMKGKRVERRFGWDTHGLPAELAAEKRLGISGRKEIMELGIAEFNAAARAEVMKYAAQWEDYVTRQARWVDFVRGYKTLDLGYMESCMWAFKALWDKNLIYKDFRVVPFSWAVESPLSNFETRLDNSYRDRTDPAITVAFKIAAGEAGELAGAQLLIWTTTPWTLPSNLAVAVGADITYAVMRKGEERFIIAANAVPKYKSQFEGAEQVGSMKGSALKGVRYHPPFDYFLGHKNAFQVLVADFVTDDEGTGIVHISPGFGEDDLRACRQADIAVVVPVDQAGRYTAEIRDYEGVLIFDANKLIIKRLKDERKLLGQQTIVHSYPHCWRTDEPLIYRAVESWYVRVSDFRQRLVELNEGINWSPAHVKHGIFGNWLAGAQDWNISRSRFWGTPIPIWLSDDPKYPRVDVYGSIAELERDFGVKVVDLHRPFIDALVRPNPDDPSGKSMMRRVEDVFDVWFESGSMPFGSVHYPFENKEWFEQNFPADFIVEYVAQTRGWFYTLMVLGTLLFDKAPFKNAVCHGVVLDENRQKLSKRLQNYPDPMAFFSEYGSDAMRWFLMSSSVIAGGDLLVPRDARDIAAVQRDAIAPLISAYSFFSLYANLDSHTPQLVRDAQDPLDRYILTKLGELANKVDEALSSYDIPRGCRDATGFLDALTNWYIRRSRARFWGSSGEEAKRAALDTLFTVLVQVCRVLAPLLPIVAEKLYKSLTGERSVHLVRWPAVGEFPQDHDLVRQMDIARDICSAALGIRERARLRVRLPLKALTILHSESATVDRFAHLIADEVNVRRVVTSTKVDDFGSVELRVSPLLGKRLGAKLKDVIAAARDGQFTRNANGTVSVLGETLVDGEFSLRLVTADGLAAEPFAVTGAVVLDTSVDEDQELEGLARDLVRAIQNARKEAGLRVSDRIKLGMSASPRMMSVLDMYKEMIARETLIQAFCNVKEGGVQKRLCVAGHTIQISFVRV